MFVVAGFLSLLCGAADAANPADAVLLQARAAMGGKAPASVHGFEERGFTEESGHGPDIEIVDLENGRIVETETAGGHPTTIGLRDGKAWKREGEGYTQTAPAEDRIELVNDLWQWRFQRFDPATDTARRTLIGTTPDGHDDIVEIVPAGGSAFRWWIGRKDHLVSRVTETYRGLNLTAAYSDFRPLFGGMWPFQADVSLMGGPLLSSEKITSIHPITTPIPESTFEPPPPPRDNLAFPAGRHEVTVPFLLSGNHIYVEAVVAGLPKLPMRFGASLPLTIDTDAVRFLALRKLGTEPTGPGLTARLDLYAVPVVTIGGVSFRNMMGFAAPLSHGGEEDGVAATAGVLGYDILRRAVVTIDYPDRLITLTDPATFHGAPKATRIPITIARPYVKVPVTLDGHPGAFAIETSGELPVAVFAGFASRAHLATCPGIAPRVFAWDSLPRRGATLAVHEATIGAGTVLPQPVQLVTGSAGLTLDGIIGAGALRDSVVTFDLAHEAIWLARTSDAPIPEDRSGIWLATENGTLLVKEVIPGSPAALAGVEEDDPISRIDGRRVSLAEARALLAQPAGRHVRLTVESFDGPSDHDVVLADPPSCAEDGVSKAAAK